MYILIDAYLTIVLAVSFLIYVGSIRGKRFALQRLDVVVPVALLNFFVCSFGPGILFFTLSSFVINWYFFSSCEPRIHLKPFIKSALVLVLLNIVVTHDPFFIIVLPMILLLNSFISLAVGIGILGIRGLE